MWLVPSSVFVARCHLMEGETKQRSVGFDTTISPGHTPVTDQMLLRYFTVLSILLSPDWPNTTVHCINISLLLCYWHNEQLLTKCVHCYCYCTKSTSVSSGFTNVLNKRKLVLVILMKIVWLYYTTIPGLLSPCIDSTISLRQVDLVATGQPPSFPSPNISFTRSTIGRNVSAHIFSTLHFDQCCCQLTIPGLLSPQIDKTISCGRVQQVASHCLLLFLHKL